MDKDARNGVQQPRARGHQGGVRSRDGLLSGAQRVLVSPRWQRRDRSAAAACGILGRSGGARPQRPSRPRSAAIPSSAAVLSGSVLGALRLRCWRGHACIVRAKARRFMVASQADIVRAHALKALRGRTSSSRAGGCCQRSFCRGLGIGLCAPRGDSRLQRLLLLHDLRKLRHLLAMADTVL